MGMDVYGLAPADNKGEYFRNNVWYWHPLWDYCLDNHNDVVGDHNGDGHMNGGFTLDEGQSLTLGNRLLDDIENGKVEAYRIGYYEHLADLPRVDCELCGATGIRTDKVGYDMGQPDKALSPEVAILVGREFGWCNGCDGIGTKEHFNANYPFDTENVREFAEFCIASGGFEIW